MYFSYIWTTFVALNIPFLEMGHMLMRACVKRKLFVIKYDAYKAGSKQENFKIYTVRSKSCE